MGKKSFDLREHTPAKVAGSLGTKEQPLWDEQEDRLAKRFDGRRQPGSGSGSVRKGDVEADAFLVEAKSTVNRSISIKVDYLAKITKEAAAVDRTPALAITFEDVPAGIDRDWVLVPASFFEENGEKGGESP